MKLANKIIADLEIKSDYYLNAQHSFPLNHRCIVINQQLQKLLKNSIKKNKFDIILTWLNTKQGNKFYYKYKE